MATQRRSVFSYCLNTLLLGVLLATSGCLGSAWKGALREDTPAAYYRFMRDYPDSDYAELARERLDFHKLKRRPTLAGYEAFIEKYPGSALVSELQPTLAGPAFEAARAWGTAEAYRGFLDSFGTSEYAARAAGNAAYVEAVGFGGDPSALGAFAQAHPESDFAPEAARTSEAMAARNSARIQRVGLEIEIEAGTPEAARVRRAIFERIEDLTEKSGIQIIPVPEIVDAATESRLPRARLLVNHREVAVDTQVDGGALSRPGVVGQTRVRLLESPTGESIADRLFELRVDDKAHVPGTSVLFSSVAPRYWDEFFVPIASWRNDKTIRPVIALSAPVVDIDGIGERAVVLHDNGSFDLLGLADPTQPIKLGEYVRADDFKKWSGIRVLDERIAIFGEEGLELIRFSAEGPVAEKSWDRTQIGRVLSIAQLGSQLVIVGNKGMQLLDPETGTIRRIMRRVVQSVASAGETLIFVDGESIYISSLERLAQNRVIAQMKLGRTFGPKNVRVLDNAGVITGPGGVLIIDLANPQAPKALAKLSTRDIGNVVDATRVRGRTFLVGIRGLQLLTRDLRRVEETIDVGARNRVAVMGRHLVTSDAKGLQVVDATPWAVTNAPAAADAAKRSPDALLNGTGF